MKIFSTLLAFAVSYFLFYFDFCTKKFYIPESHGLLDTVFGGLILAVILFFLKEVIFTVSLSGEWEVEETIISSTETKDPVEKIQYVYHVLQNGVEITCEVEKVSEDSIKHGHIEFERKKRTTGNVRGFIRQQYIGKSTVSLLMLEDGLERKSRSSFELTIINSRLMHGSFKSTAADAYGKITFKKKFPL